MVTHFGYWRDIMKILVNVKELQKARIKKGYSQRELARQAGVSSLTVNYLEQNKSIPRPATLRKLCIALDLDITEICNIL